MRLIRRWPRVATAAVAAGALVVASCSGSSRRAEPALEQADDPWFRAGQEAIARNRSIEPIGGRARNVILFIGDGLDVPTVTAARIFDGQQRGASGEENLLSFERLPYRALLKTYNTNQQVADSAGSGTALLSGVKTKAGVIGLDDGVVRGDCASAQGREVSSLFELAQRAGLGTGIVTTARLTHATPAAAYGHSVERTWESDADMPPEAAEHGCVDLARQLVEGPVGSSLQVALGGGRGYFLPDDADDPEGVTGLRSDERNLVRQWEHDHPDGRFVWNRDQLRSIDPATTDRVLGLFGSDHMAFEVDRDPGPAGEPSLTEMTAKALDLLERDGAGFLLLVEAGRIDHAHHHDNAYRALAATVELANAVQLALDRTDPEDTLIVVTSDHGHTMTISGYPTRGNPILGLVVGNDASGNPRTEPTRALDGKPYTTLNYANGPSGRRGSRPDLSAWDTTKPTFQEPADVPLSMETHGGADVPSYALGPMAHLLSGTEEQSYVFHVIVYAADLGRRR